MYYLLLTLRPVTLTENHIPAGDRDSSKFSEIQIQIFPCLSLHFLGVSRSYLGVSLCS